MTVYFLVVFIMWCLPVFHVQMLIIDWSDWCLELVSALV